MHGDRLMPVLFVGHGSPTNAIEDNAFSESWRDIARRLPEPSAILCISAHWETRGTRVTVATQPRTIHDFYGFPEALYQVQYPAPGAPEWAERTRQVVRCTEVRLDDEWGLDHGTWSVLVNMYPDAHIPTYQMSLDRTQPPRHHYGLGRELRALRAEGLLILGSGNLVHNLRLARQGAAPYDWAVAFDEWATARLVEQDHQALIDYGQMGQTARLAVPTNEHYLPLLYAIATQGPNEKISFACPEIVFGSVSMRALIIGEWQELRG
jgi:4,5-DOPA dioxygenase extradiol